MLLERSFQNKKDNLSNYLSPTTSPISPESDLSSYNHNLYTCTVVSCRFGILGKMNAYQGPTLEQVE